MRKKIQFILNSMSRPTSAKKLVIKAYREKPKLPTDFEESTWSKLSSAVQAIHTQSPVTSSYQELYQAVQDMCLHNLAPKMFSQLQELCAKHIEKMIAELGTQTVDAVAFLEVVNRCWDQHCAQMNTIRQVFMHLDRSFVLQSTSVRSLWEMALTIFRNNFTTQPGVWDKTLEGVLLLIERERCGDAVDRPLLRNLLRMCSALGIYTEAFEVPFLQQTSNFYQNEAAKKLEELPIADYLQHVETRLNQESDRITTYLDHATRKLLLSAVEKELLEKNITSIIERGFDSIMAEKKIDDLKRMYQLLGRVSALGSLKLALSAFVKRTGADIVMNEEQDEQMVQALLDFKENLDSTLDEAFESNEDFSHAVKDSFESFINMRQNKPAQLVAKFIDALLRSGNKITNDEELETTLDKVMVIFRFIGGKDVFEAFYKKHLAKRLLMSKSASVDAEKSMISKLKHQCGSAFTNKLEGMFKDVDLSHDIMTSFKESSLGRSRSTDFDMNVHVLTTGFWPNYPPLRVTLPKQLSDCQETFKMFYLSKYSGRRLSWQHSLGHCTLRAKFPLGTKDLQVSLFQTVILLMFNDAESLSFKDISDAANMDDKELRVTLQSLACGKTRVLHKKPKGREIEDNDSFSFNKEFTNKLKRIKINTIQMQETPEDNANTTEKVFQDRQYLIDAAVVRIMKARKSLGHQLLISELFKQLKFPVAPAQLKKRIESLIEREYLERDAANNSMYHYVA